ncbi:MAG: hypothetical protein E6344_13605 [Clostridium sp.]|uniref:hypothetical protein n=1 Tax=Clostridium culturomicium TaxID=1499683 RepID=UPI000AA75E6E|nr:hypothetical protein [Clostridium culturomicium]MDU4892587.1 hypothetical protein [Clostridium sp.]MDU7084729.1 hypothetical protein [Clostridium sp.]
MSSVDNDLKEKFHKIEVTQVEKYSDKVSSALVVGVVVGAVGLGYKVTKTLLKIRNNKK